MRHANVRHRFVSHSMDWRRHSGNEHSSAHRQLPFVTFEWLPPSDTSITSVNLSDVTMPLAPGCLHHPPPLFMFISSYRHSNVLELSRPLTAVFNCLCKAAKIFTASSTLSASICWKRIRPSQAFLHLPAFNSSAARVLRQCISEKLQFAAKPV